MLRGWSTEIPSSPGRGGIHIRASGLAVRTCLSDSASESVGSAALGGAGAIGDSTGITTTQLLIMVGTTLGAPRSTTETTTTAVEPHTMDLMAGAAEFAWTTEEGGHSNETTRPPADN